MKRPLFLIDHISANVFKFGIGQKKHVGTGFIRARQVDKKYWSENLRGEQVGLVGRISQNSTLPVTEACWKL